MTSASRSDRGSPIVPASLRCRPGRGTFERGSGKAYEPGASRAVTQSQSAFVIVILMVDVPTWMYFHMNFVGTRVETRHDFITTWNNGAAQMIPTLSILRSARWSSLESMHGCSTAEKC